MSAEKKLREAAKVLRERAQAAGNRLAFPHPWGVREPSDREFDHVGIAAIVTTNPDDNGEVTDWIDVDCATYIATMHPGVGLALADWLDDMTQRHDFGHGWCHHCRQSDVCGEGRKALAVADAILGGAS